MRWLVVFKVDVEVEMGASDGAAETAKEPAQRREMDGFSTGGEREMRRKRIRDADDQAGRDEGLSLLVVMVMMMRMRMRMKGRGRGGRESKQFERLNTAAMYGGLYGH